MTIPSGASLSEPFATPRHPDRRHDDELMQLIEHGEADEGLRVLQERYGRRILHFVRGLLRDVHLAQDVTQEVFEKVFLKSHLYQPGTNFRAWLFEVARNQALSALRARRRNPRPVSSLGGPSDDDDQDFLESLPEHRDNRELEEQEFMDAFGRAVGDLPERYRTVFTLCVREGRPYQEAAERLQLPTGTVAIRIMRARKRLFQELSRHLGRLRRPPACFQ
ncbi:MAG: sigma-70 family RNA polymerase sigma factor [Planctomycetes bacterium]|nr:sigma-70 family RNA polymerase sigma factor [Planctomycetota bacterium]